MFSHFVACSYLCSSKRDYEMYIKVTETKQIKREKKKINIPKYASRRFSVFIK